MKKKVLGVFLVAVFLFCGGAQPFMQIGSAQENDPGTVAVDSPDYSVADPYESVALFDGVPDFDLDGTVALSAEGGAGMDGSPISGEDFYDSFFNNELAPIAEAFPYSSFDGAGPAAEVGDPEEAGTPDLSVSLSGDDGEIVPAPEMDGADPFSDSEGLDGGSAPYGYYLEISSAKCRVGNSIEFYTEFQNTTASQLIVYHRESETLERFNISPYVRYRLTFNRTGTFALFLLLGNPYGIYNGWQHNQVLNVSVGAPPEAYWMSISSTRINVGQAVRLNIDKKNASRARLIIKDVNSNIVKYNDYVNDSPGFNMNYASRFAFYLITENDFGSFDGSQYNGFTLYCDVVDPAPSAYSWRLTGRSSLELEEKTTIEVSDLGGASSATVYVEKDGEITNQLPIRSPTTLTFSSKTAGSYLIYMITKNNSGSYNGKTGGKTIRINVNGAPSRYWMSISTTSCEVGDEIRFKIDPYTSSSYEFVLERNGSVIFQKDFGTSTGVKWTPNNPGKYRIYLITHNSAGSFNGGNEDGYSLQCTVRVKSQTWVNNYGYAFANGFTELGYHYKVENNQAVSLDKMSLASYRSVFGYASGTARYLFADNWGGSCFGFASTAAWVNTHLNYNFASYYNSSNSTVRGIAEPRNKDSKVTRMLERFQLSQEKSEISDESDRNRNNLPGLINAVEAYETGGPAVILGVYSSDGGHALVPVEHFTSSGVHLFRVYDCNEPNAMQIAGFNANADGSFRNFVYNCQHLYTDHFDFVYANTVMDAMSSVALMDADSGNTEDYLKVVVSDCDSLSCKNSAGETVNLDRYAVTLCDSDLDGRLFHLPVNAYTIVCGAEKETTLKCSVSDQSASASAEATGKNVTFYLGKTDGSVQCSARNDTKGEMQIRLVNSFGQMSLLNADAGYLGVETDGATMRVNSDTDKVSRNGESVSLDWDFGGGIEFDGSGEDQVASLEVNAFDSASASELSVNAAESHLRYGTEGIVGTLVLKTENPADAANFDVYVALYDAAGKMLGIEKTTAVVGAGNGAATVELRGAIAPTSVSSEKLSMRVFMTDGLFVPQCGPAAYETVSVQ